MKALSVVILALTAACASVPRHAALTSPLDQLEGKTGWIHLIGLHEFNPRWDVGRFEFVTVADPEALLPAIGDVIRLHRRRPILILDYAESGEAKRLEPPTGRPLGPQDRPGLWLPDLAVVRVADVHSERVGEFTAYIVRVVAASAGAAEAGLEP